MSPDAETDGPPRPAPLSKLDRFRYEYGAEPLHLLAIAASLLIATYAFVRIFQIPSTLTILVWFGACVVGHDFIALPLHSVLSRIAEETTGLAVRPRRRMLLTLNHIRIPAALSLLLLLIYFPLIFAVAAPRYRATTDMGLDRYLTNWLLISGVLFLVSGLLYAIRLRRTDHDAPMVQPATETTLNPDAPGLAWRIGAKLTLALLGLLGLWVAALLIVGLISNFPV